MSPLSQSPFVHKSAVYTACTHTYPSNMGIKRQLRIISILWMHWLSGPSSTLVCSSTLAVMTNSSALFVLVPDNFRPNPKYKQTVQEDAPSSQLLIHMKYPICIVCIECVVHAILHWAAVVGIGSLKIPPQILVKEPII